MEIPSPIAAFFPFLQIMTRAVEFTCPHCGWTDRDYAACGHFRCSSCLTAALGPIFASAAGCSSGDAAHPVDLHRGTPARLLADLSIGLQLAVKAENYELAAILRDTLEVLRTRLQSWNDLD